VPCGAALDILRSCYSTKAVLRPGADPVDIQWWFTGPGAQLAPLSPFGSLNWSKPHYGSGEVGEVIGAPRKWCDGKRPPNACTQKAQVPCSVRPLPLTMGASWKLGDTPLSIPLNYHPESLTWYGVHDGSVPNSWATRYEVQLKCGTPAGDTNWSLRATCSVPGVGSAVDLGGFAPWGLPDRPFEVAMPTPNCAKGYSQIYGAYWSLLVGENVTARHHLTLVH
jgi:hypothetical protein